MPLWRGDGGGGVQAPRVRTQSSEEANGGQEDGGTEAVGAAVVAGCKTPPVLLSGKESLDFVTLAIQPLAVVDWFLAAGTRRAARRAALLDQHLTDFVPVIPLIPHHRGRRRQSLRNTSAPVKSLHYLLMQVEPQGTSQTPLSLLVMSPLVPPTRRGHPLWRLHAVR